MKTELLSPESPMWRLARRLLDELDHKGIVATAGWDQLPEGERWALHSVIEGLLLSWDDLKQGREELMRAGRAPNGGSDVAAGVSYGGGGGGGPGVTGGPGGSGAQPNYYGGGGGGWADIRGVKGGR